MDFCVSCALMIRYEGRVYMSHGRSLSLPGPHDTVDGVCDGPFFDHCSSYWCNWSHMEAGCLVGLVVWSLTS